MRTPRRVKTCPIPLLPSHFAGSMIAGKCITRTLSPGHEVAMTRTNEPVKIHISDRGVASVSPADIFRSAKGQEAIRKTARVVTVRKSSTTTGKQTR